MTREIEILGQNFSHLEGFEGNTLTIVGARKIDFLTISIFVTCFGSVLALILVLKDQFLLIFSLRCLMFMLIAVEITFPKWFRVLSVRIDYDVNVRIRKQCIILYGQFCLFFYLK